MYKRKLLVIGLLLVLGISSIPIVLGKHGGYYYYGSTYSPPDDGVSAVIKTINPSMSAGNQFYQWPSAVTSYTGPYWVQVGYGKSATTSYALKFYREKWDINGHSGVQWKTVGPTSGNTYHYYCERSGSTWYVGVTNIFQNSYSLSPYVPVDYQAMTESTDTALSIAGSDFNELSYKNGNDWNFWDRHLALKTDYTFTEDGHYHWYK